MREHYHQNDQWLVAREASEEADDAATGMYDFSEQIEAFRYAKVRLTTRLRDRLVAHRKANRDRLIARLPTSVPKAKIGAGNFKPQGSFAMGTIVQTKFSDEEYDIDDGLVVPKSRWCKADGTELTHGGVRDAVLVALKDSRFKRQPRLFTNCVRVFYADEDAEKHHVDFAVYRTWTDDDGKARRELASATGWIDSDPTQVNSWFGGLVEGRNKEQSGWGTQLRHLVQLLKRFCRSRRTWLSLLPNGMKLTMLAAECQPPHNARIDEAFRELLENLAERLLTNKEIRNLAHPDQPLITRGSEDDSVVALLSKIELAVEKLEELDETDNRTEKAARTAWDWVFQSDGFFDDTKTPKAASRFDVPWCEPPPWPMALVSSVELTGRWSAGKARWTAFASDGPPLPKHLNLRFQAQTDAQPPFSVYWQVVNTGAAALRADAGRGRVIASSTAGYGGLKSTTVAREESTLYPGMHWIECFIVRDGKCVARSGSFVVNIG